MTVTQCSAKKPSQKAKGAAALDVEVKIRVEWVVEHARQVSALLPGGDANLLACMLHLHATCMGSA